MEMAGYIASFFLGISLGLIGGGECYSAGNTWNFYWNEIIKLYPWKETKTGSWLVCISNGYLHYRKRIIFIKH
jgi:hypothetical protein